MCTVRVKEVLSDRILVSRESAQELKHALASMISAATTSGKPSGATSMRIDFDGVEGIAPSFMDELLSVFETILESDASGLERRLVVANPPTRLSLKFEAIARGHGMSVRALSNGTWLLSQAGKEGT